MSSARAIPKFIYIYLFIYTTKTSHKRGKTVFKNHKKDVLKIAKCYDKKTVGYLKTE